MMSRLFSWLNNYDFNQWMNLHLTFNVQTAATLCSSSSLVLWCCLPMWLKIWLIRAWTRTSRSQQECQVAVKLYYSKYSSLFTHKLCSYTVVAGLDWINNLMREKSDKGVLRRFEKIFSVFFFLSNAFLVSFSVCGGRKKLNKHRWETMLQLQQLFLENEQNYKHIKLFPVISCWCLKEKLFSS